MNWDAIGAVAEMLGAIAVIATLLYLSKQIKSSEKTTRNEMRHRHMEAWRDRNREASADPDQLLLTRKIGNSLSDDEFTERELQIWRSYSFSYFIGLQANFDLYREGIFTEKDFEYLVDSNLKNSLTDQIRTKLAWSRMSHLFHDDFREYVDDVIRKTAN